MRTLRNVTTAEDLIAAWPTLKAKALSSPPGVTEAERRMLLDLPDEDVESANIAIATNLSRDQLLEKAISHHEDLTSEEVAVLKNKFWTPRTREESKVYLKARKWISLEAIEEDCVLCQHLGPLEMAAFSIAMHEFWSRDRAAYNAKKAIIANGALPFAKKWIQDLYEQGKPIGVMYVSTILLLNNLILHNLTTLAGIIDEKWQLLSFNAPINCFAPSTNGSPDNEDNVSTDDETNYQRAAALRKAFKSIVDDPDEYQESDGVHPPYCGKTFTGNMKNGIAGSGLLTNTFLVIDPPCIDLVLSQSPFYDDLRVLVIEADFPVKGHEYVEGYEGFTWVRLDQLVYNFYELRMVRNGSTGMDEIWEAAQRSRNQAFVSMEAGEDHFTGSRRMAGFTRDSVLGKDFYPM
ncbi:hypothetical protein ONS96_005422 [Cadophora gregata f. sp. sojae]|nr:hypothetical protein ONS96_005422 [Cadophora gregata f. sp. sojae]